MSQTVPLRRAHGQRTPATGAEVAQLNARIDRLPAWGLSPFVFVLLGCCYFFSFYDITAISVTLPTISDEFHLTGQALSLPVTANLIGYIIGAYGFGTLADYVGRRLTLAIIIVILAVGAILTAFTWDLASLTGFRFLIGIGIGAQIALSSTMISEYSSAQRRGRYVAYNAFWGAVGLVTPPFVALALVPIPHIGWRILFGIPTVVVFLLVFLQDRFVPESPRWLILDGQGERARELVARMEAQASRVSGQPVPPPPQVPPEEPGTTFPTLEIFRGYPGRIALVFAFWFFFYLTAYAYTVYEPTLLVRMGTSVPTGILYTALALIGFPIGAILQTFLVDRVQRKYVVVCGLVISAIGLILVATAQGPAQVVAGGFIFTMGNYGALVPAYTYSSEVFPTRARASGMAIGDGVGHLGGAVQPFIVLALLAALGPRSDFWWMAGMVVVALLIMLGGVRSTGESLTRIAR
jgi:putative MFS transporter